MNQSEELIRRIRESGGEPVSFPVIRIGDPENWEACDLALKHIKDYDWIIFSSENAVRFFINRARAIDVEIIPPKIAVVGEKTKQALESVGLKEDLMPLEYTAKGMLEAFKAIDIHNKKVLIPTSDIAREELITGLEKRGANICKVCVYRTLCNTEDSLGKAIKNLENTMIDAVLFYSPSAVQCFYRLAGDDIVKKLIRQNTVIASIGPTTAKAIRNYGWPVNIIPEKSSDESMIEALARYFKQNSEVEAGK
ncbi:MAG: uroporphyrinogen-III synthase [Calditrichaceae bacterium]|nr:uroporphyrinogen-III synthase [Calditrichaceae bacterium]